LGFCNIDSDSCNRNLRVEISTAPTKAKLWKPALNQNKIDRQRVRFRESSRQTVRWLWWMVFGLRQGEKYWEDD